MGIRDAWINVFAASHLVPSRARLVALRLAGCDVPLRGRIAPGVIFRTTRFSMGERSTVNYRCVFDNRAPVTIGSRVGIGIGVTFITSNHDMSDPTCRAGSGTLAPITVGDGAWIGSGATILPGVAIGEGSVIAAGAVVTKDCDAHGVYAGVPARRLRDLSRGDAGA